MNRDEVGKGLKGMAARTIIPKVGTSCAKVLRQKETGTFEDLKKSEWLEQEKEAGIRSSCRFREALFMTGPLFQENMDVF